MSSPPWVPAARRFSAGAAWKQAHSAANEGGKSLSVSQACPFHGCRLRDWPDGRSPIETGPRDRLRGSSPFRPWLFLCGFRPAQLEELPVPATGWTRGCEGARRRALIRRRHATPYLADPPLGVAGRQKACLPVRARSARERRRRGACVCMLLQKCGLADGRGDGRSLPTPFS